MADLAFVGARPAALDVRVRHAARRAAPTVRRTVSAALRTGGEPIPADARTARSPPSVVLLLDVAGRWRPTPRVAALRARGGGRADPGRGVRPRHPTHPSDPPAGAARSRSAFRRTACGGRLDRGVPGWGRACGSSTTCGGCGVWPGRGRGDPVRRLGPGRSRGARRADGPAGAGGPSTGLGEPAQGRAVWRPWPGDGAALPTSTSSSRGIAVESLVALAEPCARPGRVSNTRPGQEVAADEGSARRLSNAGPGANGRRVAVWSAPRDQSPRRRGPGPMVVSDQGEVAGSVSGGCVEGAVVTTALEILNGERESVASSPSATPTTRCSRSVSPAGARSTCSSNRSTGSADDGGGSLRRVAGCFVSRGADRLRWPRLSPARSVGAQAAGRATRSRRLASLGDADLDRVVVRDAPGELEAGSLVATMARRRGRARK